MEVLDEDEVIIIGKSTIFSMSSWQESLAGYISIRIKNGGALNKGTILYEEHLRWMDGCASTISDILEQHFPNRWELTPLEVPIREEHLISIYDSNSAIESLTPLGLYYYKVIIYFPEILITNRENEAWKIKDFYVIFKLDCKMSIKSIKGYRATKTVVEYRASYNHSHCGTGNNSLNSFCFGSTSLDSLVAELGLEIFNPIKFELFLQNLPDYLSWESIDGTPYYSITCLLNPPQDSAASQPSPRLATWDTYYKQLTLKYPNIPIDICYVRGQYVVRVQRQVVDELLITICAREDMFPRSSDGISVYTRPTSQSGNNAQISTWNTTYKTKSQFSFKGTPVVLTIEEKEKEEEKKEEELYPDTRIVTYVTTLLQEGVKDYLHDKFLYGTKERNLQKV